jgi:hypothetical protein
LKSKEKKLRSKSRKGLNKKSKQENKENYNIGHKLKRPSLNKRLERSKRELSKIRELKR